MNSRPIPKLDNSLLYPLIGWEKKNRTEEKYLEEINKFEKKCEASLIETFSRLNIQSSVKTDRYSLPYKKELVTVLSGESYLNGAYEFYRVTRPIVKEILNQNLYKIRFYLNIEIRDPSGYFFMGSIKYNFRYYPH